MGLTAIPSFPITPSRGAEPHSSFPGDLGTLASEVPPSNLQEQPKIKGQFPHPTPAPTCSDAKQPPKPLVIISSRCSPLCRGCLDALDPLKFQLWPWLRAGSLPLLFPSLSTSIMESQSSPGHGHHLHQQQDGRADGWGGQEVGEDGRTSGRS